MIAFCKHLVINLTFNVVMWLVSVAGIRQQVKLRLADDDREFIIPRTWMFFDPAAAAALGNPNKAAIYHKVKAWVDTNTRAGRGRHGDKVWSFNSYRQWAEDEFSWLHKNTVGKALKALVDDGWLISEKHDSDGTLRYTVSDKSLYPLQRIVVPPTMKACHNNKSQQKTLPKTQKIKPAATRVLSSVTSTPPSPSRSRKAPTQSPVAPAAAETIPDSGEFFSGIIQEGLTHSGERNEPVDAPVETPANMGLSSAGGSLLQEPASNAPRKAPAPPNSAPPPSPTQSPGERWYDVPEWSLDFQDVPEPTPASVTVNGWTADTMRDVRLFFDTSTKAQLDKMFASYAPETVLGWIAAARKMPGLTNRPGYVVKCLKNRETPPPALPPVNPYISGKYAGIVEH